MAKTRLTPKAMAALQSFVVTAGAADFTWASSDISEGNCFACTGKEYLLVNNTDVGVATVTIDGMTDEFGRDAAITNYSLAAGDFAIFGPLSIDAYKQADGDVYVTGSIASVKLAVIRVP